METSIERIEKYFAGELTPDEARQLVAEVQQDAELGKEFRAQRILQGVIETHIEQDLREKMKRWDEADARQARPFSIKRIMPYAIAACLAGVMAFAALMQYRQHGDAALFAAAYASPEFDLTRGAGESTDAVYPAAMMVIAGKRTSQYAETIQTLEALDESSPRFAESRYLLGHLRLLSSHYAEARRQFEYVAAFFPSKADEAQWYIALTLLKMGDKEALQASLEQIAASPEHAYGDPAQELLDKLDSFWRFGR